MADQLETESLLASIGPERILDGRPTLHKYQLEDAAGVPREMRRRLLRFLATDEFVKSTDMPEFDYRDALKLVSREPTPDEAQRLFAVVPDQELATDLAHAAEQIRTWANQAIPREVSQTIAGARVDDPDPVAQAGFERVWQVAMDPLCVLQEMAEGCLSDDQVAALVQLYPAIYQEMRQAVTDAVLATKSRRGKNWDPVPDKAAQLATLLQSDLTDPQSLATIQGVYAQTPQPGAAGGGGGGGGSRSKSKGDDITVLTPGQKAAGGM